MENTIQTPKRMSYWLVAKSGCNGTEILTTGFPNDRPALPVFSFEEEAEMFICLRGARDGWQTRETGPGELLSMLYTTLNGVGSVTLDPVPESSCLDTSGLLSIPRQDFMARLLERAGNREASVKKKDSKPPPLTNAN